MIIRRKVGPKGQIVIPKDIRDNFAIKIGSEIEIEVKEEMIIIKPAQPREETFLERFFASDHKLTAKIDIKKILEQQYDQGK